MVGAILVIIIPFLIFAIILSKVKGSFLLAGYNTMSDRDKEKYREEELCKFMSKIMYGICFSLLLIALSEHFKMQFLLFIGIILIIGLIVFILDYCYFNANCYSRDYSKG